VTGTTPRFVNEASQDYELTESSACRDAGTALNPLVLPDHALDSEYVKHQASRPRPTDQTIDIGAFEFGACPADVDADGDVDLSDLGILLAAYGCAGGGCGPSDIDADGDVDLSDLGILLAAYGSDC
jgi:hypothetical protein